MAYDNHNSGVLFRNKSKTTPDQPTHTGSCNIVGVEYWLSARPHESQKGWVACRAKIKDEDSQAEPIEFDLVPENKPSGSKKPDYTGETQGCKIACWINTMTRDTTKMRAGDKYLSMKFTPPEHSKPEPEPEEVDESEIPF